MSRMWQKILVAALIVAAIVLAVGFMMWLMPFLLIKNVMTTAYQQLILASMPRRLAFGVLLIAGTPFILAVMRLFSLRAPFLDDVWPPKKLHAFALVGLYVGGFSVFMFFLTRDQHFMPGQKDYICTVDYKFYEREGVCPVHGKPLQAVTPEIVEIVQHVEKHGAPHAITLGSDGPFVDAATGQPAVWFGEQDGRLIPYSGPGFDPVSGARLVAATPEVVARFRQDGLAQRAEEQEAVAQAAARRQEDARHAELLREAQGLAAQFQRDPDNSDLACRVGQAYARAGDRSAAIAAYRKALWIDPSMDQAREAIRRLGGNP
jgi:hypothetical protein